MIRTKVTALVLASFIVGLAVGCASAPPAAAPATIAHYGADVLEGVKAATDGVITLNKSGVLPDDVTRTILANIGKANDAAGRLETALRVYDAASALAKSDALSAVTQILNETNALFSSAFNVQLPAGVVGQVNALTANVSKTVLAIQNEIAKVNAS